MWTMGTDDIPISRENLIQSIDDPVPIEPSKQVNKDALGRGLWSSSCDLEGHKADMPNNSSDKLKNQENGTLNNLSPGLQLSSQKESIQSNHHEEKLPERINGLKISNQVPCQAQTSRVFQEQPNHNKEEETEIEQETKQTPTDNITVNNQECRGADVHADVNVEKIQNVLGCQDEQESEANSAEETNGQAPDNQIAGLMRHSSKLDEPANNAAIESGCYIRSFTVGRNGGVCYLENMGVWLIVPENAMAEDTKIFLGLSKKNSDVPPLMPLGGYLYSPVIVCGPHGLTFRCPVYLVFQHSLFFLASEEARVPKLFRSETALLDACDWKQFEGRTMFTRNHAVAAIHGFTKYVWATNHGGALEVHRVLRVLVFKQLKNSSDLEIRVYPIDAEDGEEHHLRCIERHGELAESEVFLFSERQSENLSIKMIPGGNLILTSPRAQKEVGFQYIINNRQDLRNHCTFVMEVQRAGPYNFTLNVSQARGQSKTIEVTDTLPRNRRSLRDSGRYSLEPPLEEEPANQNEAAAEPEVAVQQQEHRQEHIDAMMRNHSDIQNRDIQHPDLGHNEGGNSLEQGPRHRVKVYQQENTSFERGPVQNWGLPGDLCEEMVRILASDTGLLVRLMHEVQIMYQERMSPIDLVNYFAVISQAQRQDVVQFFRNNNHQQIGETLELYWFARGQVN